MHRSALPKGQKTKPSKECKSHARNDQERFIPARPDCRHTRRVGRSRKGRTNPLDFLARHVCGDWGELSEGDRKENELSLKQGLRLLSSYRTSADDTRVWVITEADRSATTILLPEEY
jgi:hypothetical protein